ncbi:hypothetical protein CJ178_24950 [Rhodococcus sp. ACPA4]|jgi:hypothetical protein|uniref:LppU protein n=1 Tax=Rhodococcus globerulus TaxID=33008 RepID=A0ABU4C0G8_RHOGO|nr:MULTISPECIES: hypothetical protein [Rhodococcus]MCE4264004.1 hypothetical protein [Rhodococcus globerulus]MDV6269997.1 hypothetical protein [Rhodococcus globerulus]MDV8067021.1 hypothetical protein [Rhodococcus sp. IEGM 1366]PBC37352.1 hypothetical protein CJ178_24950 [Rhodococcus sp. ACPA4]RZL24700.1 MAG: hypothetical protein EOP31_14795 [Rhodococcus sp. (in: high G+C Gram-positive bacteria)]
MSGIVGRLCTAVIATSAIAIFATGCGSDVEPKAIAESSSTVADSTTTSASTTTSKIDGQEGTDAGGDVDIDVNIGDCVKIGGTTNDAEIDHAVCGSDESNYKVVAKAPTSDECASDIDQTYYETLLGQEQGAVCLDIDWVVGGCMDLGPGGLDDEPARIDCADSGSDVVQVIEILQGSTSIEDCGSEADSGFEHAERKFTVCTATL